MGLRVRESKIPVLLGNSGAYYSIFFLELLLLLIYRNWAGTLSLSSASATTGNVGLVPSATYYILKTKKVRMKWLPRLISSLLSLPLSVRSSLNSC